MAKGGRKTHTLETLLKEEIKTGVSKAVAEAKLASAEDIKEITKALKTLNKAIEDLSRQTQLLKSQLAEVQRLTKLVKPLPTDKKGATLIPASEKSSIKVCSVNGCTRKHYARGMCKNHYYADLRKKKLAALAAGLPLPTKPSRKRKRGPRVCSVKGCEEKHYAKGLCKKHYMVKFFRTRKKTTKQ